MSPSEWIGKTVLVTTELRGVFCGVLKDVVRADHTAALTNARNCTYWSADVRGFLGLAAKGPTSSCRIGPAAPSVFLEGVTSISLCTDNAVAAWEAEPWA